MACGLTWFWSKPHVRMPLWRGAQKWALMMWMPWPIWRWRIAAYTRLTRRCHLLSHPVQIARSIRPQRLRRHLPKRPTIQGIQAIRQTRGQKRMRPRRLHRRMRHRCNLHQTEIGVHCQCNRRLCQPSQCPLAWQANTRQKKSEPPCWPCTFGTPCAWRAAVACIHSTHASAGRACGSAPNRGRARAYPLAAHTAQ